MLSRIRKYLLVLTAIVMWLLLSAFLQEAGLPDGVAEALAAIVTTLVMFLGPRPLKGIFDRLGVPGGAWRVIATYVASLVVGVVALAIAGTFLEIPWPPTVESALAFAGILSLSVQAAYHRLKDKAGFR